MRRLSALAFAAILALSVAAPATAKDHPSGGLDMFSATVDAATAGRLSKAGYDIADQQIQAGREGPSEPGAVRQGSISAPRRRRDHHRHPRQAGQDGAPARRPPGRQRVQRLAVVGREGRHPRRAVRHRQEERGLREARGPRPHRPGSRDHRPQGDPGGQGTEGRIAAGVPVHVEPARPRMDLGRGQSTAAALDPRPAQAREPRDHQPAQDHRAVVHHLANPDGYQYTFDHERLWRKNLRDNNGDGQIAAGDGVDPNRNFDEHWDYDNEGSSTNPSSDTYRGPAPGIRARDEGGCRAASTGSSRRSW